MTSRVTVIVGAGASGGVLAARLSEDPNERIVLVEAGPDYVSAEGLPEGLRDPFNPQLVGHDWGLSGHVVEPAGRRPVLPYPQGKAVGGSTVVNGAIGHRGIPEDYDAWRAAGNPSWGWEQVEPYFRRLERDLEYGMSEGHGDSGPIPITRVPRSAWAPVMLAFEQACSAQGFPTQEDQNTPEATGFGPVPRNQLGNFRASTLLAYLSEARDRPNLEIRADTHVHRVLFDGTRAVGVEVEGGGRIERIAADRVVLSAGAVHSPQLLLLSGVGPAEQLRGVGIESVVDLPGVGRSFCDHCCVQVVGTVTDTGEPRYGVHCELRFTSEDGPRNDLLLVPCLFEPTSVGFPVEVHAEALVMIAIVLAKPRSKGWIELASADPADSPAMHLNALAEQVDVDRLKEAIKLVYALCTSPPLAGEIASLLTGPGPEDLADDARLERWIRDNVTFGTHGASSCGMGPDPAEGAVVDDGLAVHGTTGLFVADASIMPEVTTGWVSLTCIMIGERAADLLKADATSRQVGAEVA